MQFAVFVVGYRVLLQQLGDGSVVDNRCAGVADELDDVQHLARIAAGVTEDTLRLTHLDMLLADEFVLLQRTVQQGEQIILAQGLEHIYLTAAQQWRDNLKTRVLGSGTDQGD